MLSDLNDKGKEDEITAEMTAKLNHVGNLPEKIQKEALIPGRFMPPNPLS